MNSGESDPFWAPHSADLLNAEAASLKPVHEERIVVAFTNRNQNELVDFSLYKSVGDSEELIKAWMLETLVPIPIVSVSAKKLPIEACRNVLLKYILSEQRNIRIVAAKGYVAHGGIVTKYRYAFGSMGEVISAVLMACFSLPMDESWVEDCIAEFFHFDHKAVKKVCGRSFMSIS